MSVRLTADKPSSHVRSALNVRQRATADSMCHKSCESQNSITWKWFYTENYLHIHQVYSFFFVFCFFLVFNTPSCYLGVLSYNFTRIEGLAVQIDTNNSCHTLQFHKNYFNEPIKIYIKYNSLKKKIYKSFKHLNFRNRGWNGSVKCVDHLKTK